jgi:flavin-dependent dehydrogenase
MMEEFDVIVAGAGPAGSSVANLLRQRGRSVLVLERARFPRFHIGESLLPFANDLWKELGVFETMNQRFLHKPGAKFVHEESGEVFTYYFDTAIRPGRPYAFQVKRAEFDLMLLERAVELGAVIRQETSVFDVRVVSDGVVVTCCQGEHEYQVRGRMFVDATGRDALIANRQQLKVADDLVTTNVAVHATFKGIARDAGPDGGNIILGLFDGGWYWRIPFLDGDTSVGFVFEKSFTKLNRGASAEEMFWKAVDLLPLMKQSLAGITEQVEPVLAQSNWSYRCKRFYGERMLLVGDAAAFVDPLFSTGVLLAVNGAKLACEAIDEALRDDDYRPERFVAYQDRCVAGMDLFKHLVHEFYSENLRNVLMTSAVNPTVCAIVTSMLAGDVYKPSMWHSVVREKGFSQKTLKPRPEVARPRSSRDVREG